MRHFLRDGPREGSPAVRRYSAHRAIILLGAVFLSVLLAFGAFGWINDTSEESSSTVVARDLTLVPALLTAKAAVDQFQVVVARFGTPAADAAAFPAAQLQSAAVDQAYSGLRHQLAVTGQSSLAPSLASVETAYVGARTSLANTLASGATSAQAATVLANERAASTKLGDTIVALEIKVADRIGQATDQARGDARTARTDLILSLSIGFGLCLAFTVLMARKALNLEREAGRRDAIQARLTSRNEFESRLQRALEMARSEPAVFDLVAEAFGDAAPGMHSELLLADSSRAHFRQVLVAATDSTDTGCGVVSPADCPAASRGQTMVFSKSTDMDACPNLRGRACSAVCIPVSISGNSIGVVHVTSTDGSPPNEEVRRDVDVATRRASERLAALRAFEHSQIEANSDSLTGLLTRRNLNSRVHELQENGIPYALAYGDLDHFKQLNDVFGHDAGDRALRAFSQVLRDALRPADLASRYGGEEFVIVLPACTVEEAIPVLERVRQQMAVRLASGRIPTFTVSFGVASSDQANDFDQVVALADEALLKAKAAGRDRVLAAPAGVGPRSSSPTGPSSDNGTYDRHPGLSWDADAVIGSDRAADPRVMVENR